MNNIVNPTTQALRRYLFEFAASTIAYVIVIFASRYVLRSEGLGRDLAAGWQMAIALTPLIPTVFVFVAIVRFVLGTDELQRRIVVDSLAIAGGASALLAVTYGLAEGEVLPPLSAWWFYATFMICWLIATPFVRRRYQ